MQGWGSVSSSGAFATRSVSRPSCTPESSGSRRHCGIKAAAPAMRWTDIAHALGYHDQMHMVRDFNRLSGDRPTTICGQLDMIVKPEVASEGRALDGVL